MLKSNKLFAVLTALVVASLLLAACGAPTAAPAVAPATQAPAATLAPAAKAPAATSAPAATLVPATAAPTLAPTAMPDLKGGTVTIGIANEPQTLDPGAAVMVQEQMILLNLFDSLLATAPDGTLHPGLALSWSANAAATEFTFKLRPDVKFHDGTPFNGAAVKASFDHVLDPAIKDSGARSLLVDHKYKETVLTDDSDVTIKFDSAYPTFLHDAARQWLSISSPTALTKSGKDYGRNPVGTGPFRFVKWDAQSQIVVERNPDYAWGPEYATHKGAAYLDQVVFRILPEAATRLTALQTGELQIAADPTALDAIDLNKSGKAVLETFAQPGVPAMMMLNTAKAPTDDVAVRKAMILSVNQDELAKTAFKDLGIPTYSVISPTTWGFNKDAAATYKFNLDAAGKLLDDDGWKMGADGIRVKDGKKLTIDYITSPTWEEAFNELLSGYLKKAGFDVNMRAMDDNAIGTEAAAGHYNMLYIYWTRADPSPLRNLFDSANIKDGSAYTRFVNADLDKTLADASTATDDKVRLQDYMTAQKMIMDNALVLPLFTVNMLYLDLPSVKNFEFDLEGYPWFYDMTLAK